MTTRIGCALLLWAALAGTAAAEPGGPGGDYRIVSSESELNVLIFSAGALGGLGHNHAISSHALEGSVHVGASPADSHVELSLPVESLVVDAPEARAAAGPAFEGEVGEDDRRGTRENMLGGKLLEAARYPDVQIVSESIDGEFSRMSVQARIEIKGSPHEVELPVSAAFHGERLIAIGRTEISHEELGLEPFSAGFGTLRVAEDMVFRYRIVAEKDRTPAHATSRAGARIAGDAKWGQTPFSSGSETTAIKMGSGPISPAMRGPTTACSGRGSAPRNSALSRCSGR